MNNARRASLARTSTKIEAMKAKLGAMQEAIDKMQEAIDKLAELKEQLEALSVDTFDEVVSAIEDARQ